MCVCRLLFDTALLHCPSGPPGWLAGLSGVCLYAGWIDPTAISRRPPTVRRHVLDVMMTCRVRLIYHARRSLILAGRLPIGVRTLNNRFVTHVGGSVVRLKLHRCRSVVDLFYNLLAPFHGAIAVPSVTHCRCRRWRRGHRCAGGVRQYSGDTW